jgi:hypothetical protein
MSSVGEAMGIVLRGEKDGRSKIRAHRAECQSTVQEFLVECGLFGYCHKKKGRGMKDNADFYRGWLTDNFRNVSVDRTPGQAIQVSVPGLYQITDAPAGFQSFLHGTVLRKHVGHLLEMKSSGYDEESGYARLGRRVMLSSMFGDICCFQPKQGQSAADLVPGRNYEIVHRDDPSHDHDSTALYDFRVLYADRDMQMKMAPFDEAHIHLRALGFGK